jgi:hypothetical protein
VCNWPPGLRLMPTADSWRSRGGKARWRCTVDQNRAEAEKADIRVDGFVSSRIVGGLRCPNLQGVLMETGGDWPGEVAKLWRHSTVTGGGLRRRGGAGSVDNGVAIDGSRCTE